MKTQTIFQKFQNENATKDLEERVKDSIRELERKQNLIRKHFYFSYLGVSALIAVSIFLFGLVYDEIATKQQLCATHKQAIIARIQLKQLDMKIDKTAKLSEDENLKNVEASVIKSEEELQKRILLNYKSEDEREKSIESATEILESLRATSDTAKKLVKALGESITELEREIGSLNTELEPSYC